MRPEERDAALLWDMLRYARVVERLVAGKTLEDYERDEALRLAVERGIEIIGEAARSVSDHTKRIHSEIPWRPIIAQRHILAHEYGEIVNAKIWKVASEHVRSLIVQLEPIVPPAGA
jgi:uncharacterized protein with HEPN domain